MVGHDQLNTSAVLQTSTNGFKHYAILSFPTKENQKLSQQYAALLQYYAIKHGRFFNAYLQM